MKKKNLTNIYLVGPMGSGKSTVGRYLAERFAMPFFDSDSEIEKKTGVDINWIFTQEGEEGFRARESVIIKQLTALSGVIVATGGGVVVAPINRMLLAENGIVIYLNVSLAVQIERTVYKRESRPLLVINNTREKLEVLNKEREPLYKEIADLSYVTDDCSVRTLANKIYQDIKKIYTEENGHAMQDFGSKFKRLVRREKKLTDKSAAIFPEKIIKKIDVNLITSLPKKYPIYLGVDLLKDSALFQAHIKSQQVMIITNEKVAMHYLKLLTHTLQGYQCDILILPDGEVYKTLKQWELILDTLAEKKHHRDTTVIALGGGVVGDISGFAAACYQRGVAFIQVPTTLLAQVDASIGGKTAVNHAMGKNYIGAFHQPSAVVIDINTLSTLPAREFNAGLAEIIKCALIQDAHFFNWLRKNILSVKNKEVGALTYAIGRSCEIKRDIVCVDEKEEGLRALLNLGHTFGHAIEKIAGYGVLLHGEAVAIGLIFAAQLSFNKGLINHSSFSEIKALLQETGLPTALSKNINISQLIAIMQQDKKVLNNQLRMILLKSIGNAFICDTVTAQEIENLFE